MKLSNHQAKLNIRKTYIIYCAINVHLLVAIIVPFYKSMSFSYLQIFTLYLIQVGSTIICSSLSGSLIRIIGHKYTLVLAQTSLIISTALFAFYRSYGGMVLANIFYGPGLTQISVLLAFINHNLSHMKKKKTFSNYSKWFFISSEISYALGALGAGFFSLISFQLVAIIWFAIEVIGMLLILSLKNIHIASKHFSFKNTLQQMASVYTVIFSQMKNNKHVAALILIAISFLIDNLITGQLSNAYMYSTHLSLPMFGIAYMILTLSLAIVYAYSNFLLKTKHKNLLMLLHVFIMLVVYLFISLFSSQYLVIALVVYLITFGMVRTYIYVYLQKTVNTETFNAASPFITSVSSLFSSIILIPTSLMIDNFSIQTAGFLVLGILALLAIPQCLLIIRHKPFT